MKTNRLTLLPIAALVATSLPSPAAPLTNAFTYQGRLDYNGAPASGSYDLKFELFTAADGGAPAVPAVERPAQSISGGLFTVDLDFGGPGLFDGTAYWLATSARVAGQGNYVPVPERVAVRATPYAIHALKAASVKDGSITSSSLASAAVTAANLAPAAVGLTQLNAAGNPGAGQVLAYNGGGLSWITPPGGGGGSSPWLLSGVNTYYNNGNVGVGTTSPANRITVQTSGSSYGVEHTNGTVRMSTFVGGSSITAGWVGTISPHPLSFFVGDGSSSMTIATNGNVGIGTTAPVSKLHLEGAQDALGITGYQPVITFRDTSFSNKRSTLQSVDGSLNLFTENYLNGSNPFGYIHMNNTSGNVGIGSATPVGKLEIVAQDALRMIGYQPFLTLYDANAGYAGARIQSVAGELNFFPGSYLNGSNTNSYIKIDNTGNISFPTCTIRGGADLAEPFAMSHGGIEPGSVVVIDAAHPGKLKLSTRAYDKKVAGIVSGANGIKPGISMIQEDMLEAGENVALSGRVYVKADTSAGPIEAGDLLTTSVKPGRAMRAADHDKGQGAIIGKAMTTLGEGEGDVLVLVTLQ